MYFNTVNRVCTTLLSFFFSVKYKHFTVIFLGEKLHAVYHFLQYVCLFSVKYIHVNVYFLGEKLHAWCFFFPKCGILPMLKCYLNKAKTVHKTTMNTHVHNKIYFCCVHINKNNTKCVEYTNIK